ncbi:uncharacterized protein LOC122513619 isoform X3 [Polistes fuscatus]|uniref:uncharacterized protein LOC122513619 isoform X3 n=1 Tax=Polistes fuscatus TaxID=30207 RepID=UPI001CA9E486|nr:uncharacterized protein LOC122513619 isoform X3 [Polistes fuscatus]
MTSLGGSCLGDGPHNINTPTATARPMPANMTIRSTSIILSYGNKYYINLKTKMQCSNDGDEAHIVRRKFYHPVSPAGKGAKW